MTGFLRMSTAPAALKRFPPQIVKTFANRSEQ
jgi:hypothetical protein